MVILYQPPTDISYFSELPPLFKPEFVQTKEFCTAEGLGERGEYTLSYGSSRTVQVLCLLL